MAGRWMRQMQQVQAQTAQKKTPPCLTLEKDMKRMGASLPLGGGTASPISHWPTMPPPRAPVP